MSDYKYKWKTRFHTEAGYWYVEKLVYMSLPEVYDEEFKTEEEAEEVADKLNEQPHD